MIKIDKMPEISVFIAKEFEKAQDEAETGVFNQVLTDEKQVFSCYFTGTFI